MAGSAQQLTVEELEDRFRAAKDVVERSHCQAVWLLAKGHSTAEVAEIVALSPRWINKLARRYEAEGADALGDRRRGNRGARPLLDGGRPGGAAGAAEDPARRRRPVERAEGGALDRRAAGAGARARPARLGGAAEARGQVGAGERADEGRVGRQAGLVRPSAWIGDFSSTGPQRPADRIEPDDVGGSSARPDRSTLDWRSGAAEVLACGSTAGRGRDAGDLRRRAQCPHGSPERRRLERQADDLGDPLRRDRRLAGRARPVAQQAVPPA